MYVFIFRGNFCRLERLFPSLSADDEKVDEATNTDMIKHPQGHIVLVGFGLKSVR